MPTTSLPYIDVQHDALAVFDDVEQGVVPAENVWVSAYRAGEPSVHGKMRVSAEGGVEMTCIGGVEVVRESKANLLVSVPSLKIESAPVRFPKQTLVPPYAKPTAVAPELSINAIDASASGQLVVGGPDGYALVIDPSTKKTVELKGHVGDVLDVKWFPSGKVVLTASSDMSLRIFSSETGVNPRTLRGHTRAISSTAIVGVGRQVLSGGKDGSVRLWHVGDGREERVWRLKLPVDALLLVEGERAAALGAASVVIAATADGTLTGFSLDAETAEPLFVTEQSESKLISAAYSPHLGIVATGHADGTVAIRHLGTLSAPAAVVKRNEAAIYSLAFDGASLLVGTASGLPARLGLVVGSDGGVQISVKEELAGWEAVGVETFTVAGESVWAAGADGVLRRY